MRQTTQTIAAALIAAAPIAGALLAAPAAAQIQVEKRRPAPAAGWVVIDNSFGSVVVTGWDNPEVLVRGELATGAEGLDLDSDEEEVSIEVEVPDAWFYASDDDSEYRSFLNVSVPKGSSVYVETLNASVEIRGVGGEVEVESVNGSVKIAGAPRSVEVESMTGAVEISAAGAPMSVETISGDVTLRGAGRAVEVDTVSGSVTVGGDKLEAVQVETTSGNVAFRGGLCPASAKEGELEVSTFSGAVDLVLQPTVKARFELSTFSGEIRNEIGPRMLTNERFRPYKRLRFSTGLEDCEVMIETHSGDISLKLEGS